MDRQIDRWIDIVDSDCVGDIAGDGVILIEIGIVRWGKWIL